MRKEKPAWNELAQVIYTLEFNFYWTCKYDTYKEKHTLHAKIHSCRFFHHQTDRVPQLSHPHQKKLYKHMATGSASAGTSRAIRAICQTSLSRDCQLEAAAAFSGDKMCV